MMPARPERRNGEATKEFLVRCLAQAGAPPSMIYNAKRGLYDDYETELVAPMLTLIEHAEDQGLTEIADRARSGDFDATREEARRWIERQTGELSDVIDDLGLRT